MGKRNGTSLTGPLRLTKQGRSEGRQATLTIATDANGAESEHEITDADALVGDIIVVSPNVAPEQGLGIACAWVDSAGTIKVRITNLGGAGGSGAFEGGDLVVNYQILK